MKYSFIITSSLLLSLVGISALALNYAFDYSPFELIFIRGALALFLITFFIKQYVAQTTAVNSVQGFISPTLSS